MEEQLISIIEELTKRVEALESKQDYSETQLNAHDEMIHQVAETVYDEILTPINGMVEQYEYEGALDDFKSKYGAQLDPYRDMVAKVEGEDYDLDKAVYDDYKEKGITDTEGYIGDVVAALEGKLNELKEAFGAQEMAVVVDESGEAHIEADGEEVPEEVVEEVVEQEEAADEPSELEQYTKELEDYAEIYK